jgi:hypothetical protein
MFVRFMIYLALNNQQNGDMSLSNTNTIEEAYTEHYALVQKLVPKEQLLELELGSGDEWGKLYWFWRRKGRRNNIRE